MKNNISPEESIGKTKSDTSPNEPDPKMKTDNRMKTDNSLKTNNSLKTDKIMKTDRYSARAAGIFFLVAMAGSLVGGAAFIEPLLAAPDFLGVLTNQRISANAGILLEFLNALSVIGITAAMYPYLKRYHEGLALGYAALRLTESIACLTAAFVPVLLLGMGSHDVAGGSPPTAELQSIASFLVHFRQDVNGLLVPLFFGLGALLFYFMMHRLRLVPRFISIWGFIGTLLILGMTFLRIPNEFQIIFGLPIIVNEVFLGIWLITKGFSKESFRIGTTSQPDRSV